MDMLNILIYAPFIGRGGMHLVIETLTEAWDKYYYDGCRFTVLGQARDEIGIPIRWPETWKFIQIDPGRSNGVPIFEFLYKNSPVFYDHFLRVVSGYNYDIIFCPSIWWVGTGDARKFKSPAPMVGLVPDFAFDDTVVTPLSHHFRHKSKQAANLYDKVIYPSKYYATHGHALYGIENQCVISHSADFVVPDYNTTPAEAERVKKLYALPDKYVLAFHCANHKDTLTIMRAHRVASRQYPDMPPLVLSGIGTDTFLKKRPNTNAGEAVREEIRAENWKIGEELFITGYILDEDIAGLHKGAAVSVNASIMEGDLSGSTFCAIMAHTPHIWSDLPVYDRLEPGVHGLSFSVGNAARLALAMVFSIVGEEDAASRASSAYEHLSKRSAKDVASDYLQVFRDAVQKRGEKAV